MANINSIMSTAASSTSSLYGNRNVLSGLASGMDTEAMIENSISGYKSKITSLEQKQTKYQWKQDAYRDIIDRMSNLSQKYTSYTSATNLMSNSFFTTNVTTTANGTYADRVSAAGSTTSDIKIAAVNSLASSARYAVKAGDLNLTNAVTTTGSPVQWDREGGFENPALSGTLTLTYENRTVDLDLSDLKFDFGGADRTDSFAITGENGAAQKLADAINRKLADLDVVNNKGDIVKAAEYFNGGVTVDQSTGAISFQNTSEGGSVYISRSSGQFDGLNVRTGSSAGRTLSLRDNDGAGQFQFYQNQSAQEYLEGKSINFTLNGVTRRIELTKDDLTLNIDGEEYDVEGNPDLATASLASKIQTKLDEAFGSGRITVGATDEGALTFGVPETSGSTLLVQSDTYEALGLGSKNGLSNYLNTDKTLGELLSGPDRGGQTLAWQRLIASAEDRTDNPSLVDADGFRIDRDGNPLYEPQELIINGVSVGTFGQDSTLSSVLSAINNNKEAGVSVSYSNLTGEFVFAAQETGSAGKIEFGGGLASRLFTGYADSEEAEGEGVYLENYTAGQDASITAYVNGTRLDLTRSSNVIQMDGLSVTLKDTFNEATQTFDRNGNPFTEDGFQITGAGQPIDAVSFTTKSDSDTIVDAIKSFIEEYNAIAKEVHSAYSTQPLYKNSSSRTRYEPLTESDRTGMNDDAIKAYEEKAKTGLLFMDSDLSSLYSSLTSAITPGGTARINMEAIGITTEYSDGATVLKLNEDTLRAALDTNPDSVKNVFSNSSVNSDDGLMSSIKKAVDTYASTSYGNPGILVRKAGSRKNASSLLSNSIQSQIDSVQTQIERWQAKMSTKIDYYSRQFSALEQMMSTMNNQSSALAGLLGY